MDVTCLAAQLWQKCRRSAAIATITVCSAMLDHEHCSQFLSKHTVCFSTIFFSPFIHQLTTLDGHSFHFHSPTNRYFIATSFSLIITSQQFVLLHWSEWYVLSPGCWLNMNVLRLMSWPLLHPHPSFENVFIVYIIMKEYKEKKQA